MMNNANAALPNSEMKSAKSNLISPNAFAN